MAAYQASVMAALGEADIVKVSDDDLHILGFTHPDPLVAARELLAQTPRAGWPSRWAPGARSSWRATARPGRRPNHSR
jgi:hypothetical protein